MAYSKDKISEVRKRYIFDRLPLEQVAQLSSVSYATAGRWKKQAFDRGDDWDKVRTAHSLAGSEDESVARELLTELVLMFKTTMDAVKNDELDPQTKVKLLASLSDSYNKSMSANKKLMPEVSKLATALKTIELLSEYIAKHKPKLLQEFIALLEPFGKILEQEL